jgi:GGDEF domain-containing protein
VRDGSHNANVNREQVFMVAERISKEISQLKIEHFYVTTSIGIGKFNQEINTPDK